ncbi:hypothetical protein CUMW_014480 [Citrus unshiu]|nr:hypothetical protein CUMW_014480 [Citrus unshiu]
MMGRKEEIEDDQGDRDTGVGPMAWAMGLHLLMLLNRRSHLLAPECLMEPEDSQWDEVGLLSQIRVST